MNISGRIDTGSLFKEINEVFKRYGVGRGVGFVPDRLEIKFERDASGSCSLVYREFFTYLPPEVMEVATGNAVEFLSGMGVPRERIKPLDSGVEVTLEGDAKIAYFPILEMLIQDREIAKILDSASRLHEGFNTKPHGALRLRLGVGSHLRGDVEEQHRQAQRDYRGEPGDAGGDRGDR